MSKCENGTIITMVQEDTTINEYRLVKLGTDADEVVAATDGSAPIIGISTESADATAWNPVGIVINWTAKLTILAAATKWAYIIWTTAWKWVGSTTDTHNYVWILLETTTEANQVAEVLICQWVIAA